MIGAIAREAAAVPRILNALETRGAATGTWARVQYDSRAVGAGDLFVAIPGAKADGHAYLGAAHAKGALLAVVERLVPEETLPQVRVASARRALAILAAEETEHPSRELTMVGVTGTNGKTTTTHLVRSCEVDIGTMASDKQLVTVAVDCEIVPFEDGAGWDIDPEEPTTLVLAGDVCRRVKRQGARRVDVVYGCPLVK